MARLTRRKQGDWAVSLQLGPATALELDRAAIVNEAAVDMIESLLILRQDLLTARSILSRLARRAGWPLQSTKPDDTGDFFRSEAGWLESVGSNTFCRGTLKLWQPGWFI